MTPSRAELLNTIALLQGALNGVTLELTQGFNTMPRRRDLRDSVEECLAAESYGRRILERANYWREEAA
jgi:hypothetical protein